MIVFGSVRFCGDRRSLTASVAHRAATLFPIAQRIRAFHRTFESHLAEQARLHASAEQRCIALREVRGVTILDGSFGMAQVLPATFHRGAVMRGRWSAILETVANSTALFLGILFAPLISRPEQQASLGRSTATAVGDLISLHSGPCCSLAPFGP